MPITPTPDEQRAAAALAQPLIDGTLHQARRILRGESLMLPALAHLCALDASCKYWRKQALDTAALLVSASACIEDPLGQALPAARGVLRTLQHAAAIEDAIE